MSRSEAEQLPVTILTHWVENYGGIVECYATGDVTATDRQDGTSAAGGFAGQLQDNSVPVDCDATGTVTAYRYAGGFAGSIIGAAAINCYASGQVSCDLEDTAGSFAGLLSRPALTRAQYV